MAARAKPASHPVGMDTLAARAGSVGELRRYCGPQRLIDMATQMARVAIEAKRADEALRQSEDRLRLVIDTIPTMAWSLLPDGTVDFVNQRWLEYTGLSLEEALANSTRTVHPEDLPRVMEKWRTDMAVGKPCEDEMRLRRADCAALLESAARDIRSVESELRPPMLDDHGLLAALHWYANKFTRRAGIAVSVRGSQGSERARPEVEIALFRIAQEALNNVAKHAQATSVVISFGSAGSEWRMSVVDDGVGLRPHEAGQPRGGFGLVTMRERAQAIGGRFNVEGLPQGGTRITVQVPT